MDETTLMDVLLWLKENILQIIVVLGIFFEITPIKINPISWIMKFLFRPIRDELKDMKEELNKKIDSVEQTLKGEINQVRAEQKKENNRIDELIRSNDMNEISRIRWEIIEFSNSIDNGQLHTRDEYRHAKDNERRFRSLMQKYDLQDGVFDEEAEKINKHYNDHKDTTSVYF